MAGRLFDVFSTPRWSSVLEECPADLKEVTLNLRSSDDEVLELPGEAASLSGVLRRSVSRHGADVEVETMLPKSLLAKLVEYMKYHKDTAPGDIEVPLPSENLADCGASKWDAAFINVEKEVLFDLLMAANCMDIPSLEILAAAKAYLMCKGKTAEKLRKDAGMDPDLPEDEEIQLSDDYLRRSRPGTDPDEAHLATLAVVMQGMVKAAEKHGLFYMSGEAAKSSKPVADMKSFRAWSWSAAVANDWRQLAKAPEEVRANRDLVIDALRQSRGAAFSLSSSALRGDRDVVLAAIRYGNGGALAEAATALRADRAFVAEAVAANGEALAGAGEGLRGDRDFVLQALKGGQGSAMKGVSGRLSADRDFVLQCATLSAESFQHADSSLKADRDFAVEVLRKNGLALQYMSSQFRADRGLVKAALTNNPAALAFAHTAARADLGVAAPWDASKTVEGSAKADEASYLAPRQLGLSQGGQGGEYWRFRAQKSVQFSALSSMFANMGQGNYIAANMALDKFPFYQKPEIDAVTVMWGAVGAIGMRWKAFASQDFLNSTPEILMTIEDCCKVLHVLTCRMDTPEWTSASLNVSPEMMAPTAGVIGGSPGGGWRPGESAAVLSGGQPGPTLLEKKEEKQREAPIEAGPLGGWPKLSFAEEAAQEVAWAPGDLQLAVGAKVRLTGLQAKNGMTGTVQQHFPDGKGGKWKVSLDQNGGSTQLRACYLQVLAPA